MSLEPSLAATVERLTAGDRAALVDWTAYRSCPVCKAATGTACAAMSGRIVGGQTDGIRTPLPRAHVARKRRSGR